MATIYRYNYGANAGANQAIFFTPISMLFPYIYFRKDKSKNK